MKQYLYFNDNLFYGKIFAQLILTDWVLYLPLKIKEPYGESFSCTVRDGVDLVNRIAKIGYYKEFIKYEFMLDIIAYEK